MQLSEEIRGCKELIKEAIQPFNHFVIHRFKSHLWAVIAKISFHETSVTGGCQPQLDQLMLDSALSLARSSRLIFHQGCGFAWASRHTEWYVIARFPLLHSYIVSAGIQEPFLL